MRGVSIPLLVALLFGGGIFARSVAAAAASPDIIFVNGSIFSAAATSRMQALAVSGERIVAVGDNTSITALAGPHTRLLDLRGHTVIPGINDAHLHLHVEPANTVSLALKTLNPTWDLMREAVVQAVQSSPKGTLITGEFGMSLYFDAQVNRLELDKMAPDHPVVLTCLTGHAVIANSRALSMLAIGKETPNPAAGRYERASDGELTGVIREYAALGVNRKLADLTSEADAVEQLSHFYAEAAKFGITSIQDMSDAFTPQRIAGLLEKSRVPVRVRVMRMPLTQTGRDFAEASPRKVEPTARVAVSGTKWMLDGTPLEGTLTPVEIWRPVASKMDDRAWEQLPALFDQREMKSMLRETLERKDQLMLHISGYPAAASMLEAMQASGGKNVWAPKRVRFEHGDGLFADLVPQARQLGIIVVQNPAHFAVGFTAEKAFPLKSLLAAGIPVAIGSDGPLNPYLNMMFAVRHPAHGTEAISVEQAVIAYTRTAAYAEFMEHEKGTLEPGKLADLAVLSQDIFAIPPGELPKTRSILTLVGGKVIYDAGELN